MMNRILAAGLVWLGLSLGAFAQAPPPVPALPDSPRLTSYSISSSTCACSVGFAIYGTGTDVDEWIQVYVNGVAKLSTDPVAGWSLSSVTGSLGSIPRPITNAVLTFNAAQTATVVIVGDERPRRLSQFPENRGVAARDLNQAITDAVAVQRELWDKSNRSITGQPGEVLPSLPPAASRPNTYLCFDSNGLPIVCQNVQTGVGVITLPGSSVNGDSVCFNGTTGASFSDCGWKITGSIGGIGSMPIGSATGTAQWQNAPSGVSPVNPVWWGADPTGAADSTAALNNALAVSKNVRFPQGTFKFSSPISYSIAAGISGVTIEGAGPDLTILNWPTGNGLTIIYAGNGSSAHIRNLTIATGAANSGTGILLTDPTVNASPGYNAQSDITNVTFRGSDGYPPTATAFYWTTALNLTNISNINITNDVFQGPFGAGGYSTSGVGLAFTGLVASMTYGGVINVSNTSFNLLNIGMIYGSYIQGVTVSQSNFTGCAFGIASNPAETGVLTEMQVVDSQFNCTIGLVFSSGIDTIGLSNSLLLVPAGGIGLDLPANSIGVSVSGNTFDGIGAAAVGMNATAGSKFNVIGNQFLNFTAGGFGMAMGASVGKGVVQGNVFDNNATNISNGSTALQIVNNPGYNPVGVSTGTYAPLTTVTYTAGASPETHYLTGGTVTAVKIPNNAGTSICTTTPCLVNLGPLETMSVTYSGAPTDTVSVH